MTWTCAARRRPSITPKRGDVAIATTGCPRCGEDITANVYADVEGDARVIGGLHRFGAVEDVEQTCDCQLTADELDNVEQALVETESQLGIEDSPWFPC
jgi:hypothetical protein